ncbi:39S ribosomal protein L14, mitochondrial, partial [Trachymyrmex cornetzi]
VVDNNETSCDGRPPGCIHVYNKRRVGYIGDRILVAPKVSKFDSNNLVLTRSKGANYTKLITIASRFA